MEVGRLVASTIVVVADQVGTALALDAGTMGEFIAGACADHAIRQDANADDPFAPERYDATFVRPVTDTIGLTVADLDALIADYCS
jgi:hypothetical protein